MVRRGESLTPEHRAAIGRGIKRNAAARAEKARQAIEEARAKPEQPKSIRVLHAHTADQECNPSCTTSGLGGKSPCECGPGYTCLWCRYQGAKAVEPDTGWLVFGAYVKLEPGYPVPSHEQVVKALASLGFTTIDNLNLTPIGQG